MTVTPYLIVRNCAAALDFYRDAFGAVETQRLVGDDGRVGHAEITIGGVAADARRRVPGVRLARPGDPRRADVQLHARRRRRRRGVRHAPSSSAPPCCSEPADQFHGNRTAHVFDPFGQHVDADRKLDRAADDRGVRSAAAAGQRPRQRSLADRADARPSGDAARPPGQAPRAGRPVLLHPAGRGPARARSASSAPCSAGSSAHPTGPHREHLRAARRPQRHSRPTSAPRLWFVVDDIHAAVAAVRELGGTANEPVSTSPAGRPTAPTTRARVQPQRPLTRVQPQVTALRRQA